jgi:hypothetical protein
MTASDGRTKGGRLRVIGRHRSGPASGCSRGPPRHASVRVLDTAPERPSAPSVSQAPRSGGPVGASVLAAPAPVAAAAGAGVSGTPARRRAARGSTAWLTAAALQRWLQAMATAPTARLATTASASVRQFPSAGSSA